MEDDASLDGVDARDGIALLISLGIATADQHHANGCTFVELNALLVEVAGSNAFEQVDDVALQAQHDALSLRIAHAAVVLDDVGIALITVGLGGAFGQTVHQTEEDESLVVDAIGSESFHSGTDDSVFDLLHPRFVGKGNR